jgi:hypothetical protein
LTSPVEADRALVERVLQEGAVERTVPGPGLADYVQTVTEAFARWLGSSVSPLARALETPVFRMLLWAVVGLAVVALLVLVFRHSRRVPAPPRHVDPRAARQSTPVAPRDPDWRAALEERLRKGDVAGALEALWWWVARSLLPSAERSWTTRELLARAGRPDLRPLATRLDRMAFGLPSPSPADVRVLVAGFEKALE